MKVDPKQQQQENEFSLGDPYNLNSLIFLFLSKFSYLHSRIAHHLYYTAT